MLLPMIGAGAGVHSRVSQWQLIIHHDETSANTSEITRLVGCYQLTKPQPKPML